MARPAQGAEQIVAQVLIILQPDRQADQSVGESMAQALLRVIGRMGHARRVLRQGLGVAKTNGAGREFERIHKSPARRQPAFQLQRDHASERLHLPFG